MPAGPARFVEMSSKPSRMNSWHLLKVPTGAQTAVTAAKLSQCLKGPSRVSFAEDNFDFADVSWCPLIMVQLWGEASNDHNPVVNLYGWNDDGPGLHIGTITAVMGNFVSEDSANAAPGWHTNTNLPQNMQAAFPATTDYRSCDEYAITADYQSLVMIDNASTQVTYQEHKTLSAPQVLGAGTVDVSPEADFPSYFIVDLRRSRYKYLCVAVTTLNSATTVGAIFKPIACS